MSELPVPESLAGSSNAPPLRDAHAPEARHPRACPAEPHLDYQRDALVTRYDVDLQIPDADISPQDFTA